MESKLQELEQSPRVEEKNKLTVSLNRQNASEKKTRFILEAKMSKKSNNLKRQAKFDDIENIFDELGRGEDEVQHNVIKSSKGLTGSKYKRSFQIVWLT